MAAPIFLTSLMPFKHEKIHIPKQQKTKGALRCLECFLVLTAFTIIAVHCPTHTLRTAVFSQY